MTYYSCTPRERSCLSPQPEISSATHKKGEKTTLEPALFCDRVMKPEHLGSFSLQAEDLTLDLYPTLCLLFIFQELDVGNTSPCAAVPHMSTWLAEIRAMNDTFKPYGEYLLTKITSNPKTLIGTQDSKQGEVK